MFRRSLIFVLLAVSLPCLAQQGPGTECTPAGVWYGGSVTAYQLNIVPSVPAGHYTFIFQGIYKEPEPTAIAAHPAGQLVKHDNRFEGPLLSLSGDSSFVDQSPGANGKMPDLVVAWVSIEMPDCDTLKNTIPFFGMYFGAGIWQPGFTGATWVPGSKVPLVDSPDVDLLNELTFGFPIVEIYHRLPKAVNPALLHQ